MNWDFDVLSVEQADKRQRCTEQKVLRTHNYRWWREREKERQTDRHTHRHAHRMRISFSQKDQ